MTRHLASAQYWTGPGNTGRLFLTFGRPVCADWISNCPLDRVLTYKNLIYLLNLQFYKLIPYPMDRQGPPNRSHLLGVLIGLDNEKDAMTSRCLVTNLPVETQDVFF